MEFITQFVDSDGKPTGPQVTIPSSTKVRDLNLLINKFLENEEDPTPYSFYVDEEQIVEGLKELEGKQSTENVLKILYRPEATFQIKPVSFCSAKLPGHSQIVLCISFSPDGLSLVTGGGDGSVISWDLSTQSLKQRIPLGNIWIQAIEWNATSRYVATGCTDGFVRILERNDDLELTIKNEIRISKFGKVFAIQWEPLHSYKDQFRLVAATDRGEIIMINALTGSKLVTISGHSAQIMCLAWGAHDILYSASHDRTVKAWDTITGREIASYTSSGHCGAWRTMSISTSYPLRTGPWEVGKLVPISSPTGDPLKDQISGALLRLQKHEAKSPKEMVAIGNEDFTITLLTLAGESFKEIAKLPGHTKTVNHVAFSPNGYWLASASFDHSVKLWDGRTGKFMCSLGQGKGKNTGRHVKDVYRLAWSPDSRQLISASADTTLKLWNVAKQKMHNDLTGHEDAVYAVDWNPAGYPAASGGKDKQVRLWR